MLPPLFYGLHVRSRVGRKWFSDDLQPCKQPGSSSPGYGPGPRMYPIRSAKANKRYLLVDAESYRRPGEKPDRRRGDGRADVSAYLPSGGPDQVQRHRVKEFQRKVSDRRRQKGGRAGIIRNPSNGRTGLVISAWARTRSLGKGLLRVKFCWYACLPYL